MRRICHAALAAAALFITSTASAQAADDPAIGTWVLNVAKSKPANPASANIAGTRMYEVMNGKLHSKGSSTKADKSVDPYEYTAAYDGKTYPYKGANGDQIAMTSVDKWTIDASLTKGGKLVQKTRRTVSKDGKTMTMTSTAYGADGKASTGVAVYDRK